jgi:hypothetical protein
MNPYYDPDCNSWNISKHTLLKAKIEDLIRLARFIRLRRCLDQMSKRQLASLIRWRITRTQKKYRYG